MTTAGPTSDPVHPGLSPWLSLRSTPTLRRPGRLSAVAGVVAVLVASQCLAASTPQPSDVRLLLTSEGLLAGLGDGLRRGYGLAMEESSACGTAPPSLQLGWIDPGSDPLPALQTAARHALLVAPPAAPLQALGLLAEQQRLTVLLPLQRGRSLEGLPQLRGSDRIWPIVPARSLEVDRLAEALLADGVRRVMVVRDPSAEGEALSERFVTSFGNGRGVVIGPTGEPISMDATDKGAMRQLVGDVDWYRPPALVALTSPDSTLARGLQAESWPAGLLLAWPFRVERQLPQPQLGVDPLSRGPGWAAFAQRFEQRWSYSPGLVESAGYDSGQIAALASVVAGGRPGWDLHWFKPSARALPLCEALEQRRRGAAVRPAGAGSRLDISPGVSPTAALQLSRSAASTATVSP